MRLIFALALPLLALGCATPVIPTLRPAESNRYEAVFQFKCGQDEVLAAGTAECQYAEKERMSLRIKVPERTGEIQVRSCRRGRALQVESYQDWHNVEWVQYSLEDSCPVVFSVTTPSGGIQLGKIYPYVYSEKYPKLSGRGRMYCWETETIHEFRGQTSCQIPTGIKTQGFVIPEDQKGGEYLIASPCLSSSLRGSFLPGNGPIKWSVNSPLPQFCPVVAALKYLDGTSEELEYYLDFFDASYSALPPPNLVADESGAHSCMIRSYAFMDLGQKHGVGGRPVQACLKHRWEDDSVVLGVAWDRAGRSSYTLIKKDGNAWTTNLRLSPKLQKKLKLLK